LWIKGLPFGRCILSAAYGEIRKRELSATLIEAAKYFKDKEDLPFNNKLFRLTDQARMNQHSKTNSVHISLNFPNGENLRDQTLREIVKDYLYGVGFATQPYLV